MEDCLHASSEDLSKLVSWAHSHGTICALIPNLKHLLTEGAHGNLTAMWGCSAGHAYHWPLSATCRTGPKERACYQDSRSAGSDSLSMQGGSGTQASPGDRFPGRGGASKGKGDCGQTRDSCDFSNCSEPSEADDNAEDYGGNLFDMVYESSATDEDADYEPRLQSAAECHALRKRGAPGAAPGQPCRPRPEEAPGEAAVKKIKQEAQEDYYIVAHGQLGGGADGGGGAAHSPKQPCQRAALSQAALLRPSDADPASARASPSGNPAARPPRAPPLPGSQTRPPPATAQPPSRPDPLPRPPGGPPCCGPNHASNVPLLTPPRLAGHGEPSDVPPGEELAKSCCPAPLPYGDPDTSPACLNSDLEIISTQALGAEPKSEASEKMNIKRKGMKHNQWREDRMAGAITEYRGLLEAGQEPNLRCVAKAWCVPKSTLQRRVKGITQGSSHASGRKPCIPEEAEKELSSLLIMLSQRGFLLRKCDVQCIAYEFAKVNNIPGFSQAKQKAGYYWFQGFMRRNPTLTIKKPEPLSVTRAAGMNPEVVGKWFEDYQALLEQLCITKVPSHIWNCDESVLQDNFASGRVDGEVGKPCFEIPAGEKGETTTVLASFNAAGTYAPLMVIFKGKSVRSEWLYGSPENVAVEASENGWVNTKLFVEWGKGFMQQLPKDDTRPHLLLLDGHGSHVFNLEFLSLMKAHNVHVMCRPPHATLALQPADGAPFKSLKHNWCEVGRRWNRQTAGMTLPKIQFFSVFSEAWKKTATVENAQAWFRATGMYPVNSNVILAEVFAPSATTERALQSPAQAQTPQPPAQDNTLLQQDVCMEFMDTVEIVPNKLPGSLKIPN
ncbi:uncharacterized protein LOC118212736 isoform X1 [Anguilla anguilla]|uniref:uncharacterized protein LOC118212736 isoform X1 n=1 Tax=Anguilla anguilla TaxID=7936 RepID=UPI0015AF7CCF|nr:uncharacterized protein LOC118212736 isoform X1 [Anguilla anguilla]